MKRVGLLVALLSAPVWGQEALFVAPGAATVRLGEVVELRAFAGSGSIDWPSERVAHFFARTAWTQENRDAQPAEEGRPGVAAWVTDRPGVLLLGVDLTLRTESIPARDFAAFRAQHLGSGADAGGGAGVPAVGGGVVELTRIESVKALVRVEGGGVEPDSIATSKSGQAVEIRPLMDPTRVAPGSDLAVRLYAAIDVPEGTMVTATNTTTGGLSRWPVNGSKVATVRIDSPGRWRLEFHAFRGVPDDPDRAELHTATLTFDVAGVSR